MDNSIKDVVEMGAAIVVHKRLISIPKEPKADGVRDEPSFYAIDIKHATLVRLVAGPSPFPVEFALRVHGTIVITSMKHIHKQFITCYTE